jgi:hypothetical protein
MNSLFKYCFIFQLYILRVRFNESRRALLSTTIEKPMQHLISQLSMTSLRDQRLDDNFIVQNSVLVDMGILHSSCYALNPFKKKVIKVFNSVI